jgi:phosphoglycolate phosphatase
MPSFKAAIFDLDGTLLDTLGELAVTTNYVLEHNGIPSHPLDRYRYFVGEGSEVLIRNALGPLSSDTALVKKCLSEFLTHYRENCGNGTRPYDGIVELLTELKNRDVKLAVLSNKPHDLTLKNIDLFLSQFPFVRIFGQRDGIPKKPDPGVARDLVTELNVLPQECLYLGDTAIDMKTAVGAGVYPVGVLWGFRGRDELLQNGALKLIETPLDLLPILDNHTA